MRTSTNLFEHHLFKSSNCYAELKRVPLQAIDIGARGGVHPVFSSAAPLIDMLCFEIDDEQCRNVENGPRPDFARFDVLPVVLGPGGPRELHLTRAGVNCSLLTPSTRFARRYAVPGFDVMGKLPVSTQTLDCVASARGADIGEFIKIDVQGAELEVLGGGIATLQAHTVAVVAEVSFVEMYDGQPLFPDVCRFLESFGFSFYGFIQEAHRSAILRERLAQERPTWNERMIHADAVFFKDPLSMNIQLSARQVTALLFSSMLLGYLDFSIELARALIPEKEEGGLLERLARELANAGQGQGGSTSDS
jgi:FkbM family methyltransferase